jgi:hypothetical protein
VGGAVGHGPHAAPLASSPLADDWGTQTVPRFLHMRMLSNSTGPQAGDPAGHDKVGGAERCNVGGDVRGSKGDKVGGLLGGNRGLRVGGIRGLRVGGTRGLRVGGARGNRVADCGSAVSETFSSGEARGADVVGFSKASGGPVPGEDVIGSPRGEIRASLPATHRSDPSRTKSHAPFVRPFRLRPPSATARASSWTFPASTVPRAVNGAVKPLMLARYLPSELSL